ncbi:MAG: hypothetical protein PF436_06035 [Prolixibacteraceae bacterium]|nr:hypothetical protein [Prolixibacteraceae bacterium]
MGSSTHTQPTTRQPKTVVRKRTSDIGTPSITQALNGIAKTESSEPQATKINQVQDNPTQQDKPFTKVDVHQIWPQMAERYKEQVHLFKTLETLPNVNGNIVIIEVENSVQQNKIKLIKPEIIGYLRRTLQNSKIDVQEVLNKSITEKKVLTDEQKLKMMMQKNPALMLFKNKFNLDFN